MTQLELPDGQLLGKRYEMGSGMDCEMGRHLTIHGDPQDLQLCHTPFPTEAGG